MYTKGVLTKVPFHKLSHKRFNRSGPLWQIVPHIIVHTYLIICSITKNVYAVV